MASLFKTLINRSLPSDLGKTRSAYQMIRGHSIHQSRVLGHHLPRYPNQSYNPPWKPNPLFPHGTYKKAFEKVSGKTAIIIGYTTLVWSVYEKVMKVFGPSVATMAALIFLKNKELEKERKKGNEELEDIVLTKKTLDGAAEEFRVATKMKGKQDNEFKKKIVNELLKMEGFKTVEKMKVGEKLVENEVIGMMFLAATDAQKNEIVKVLLAEE